MNDFDDEAQNKLIECVDREIVKHEGLIKKQTEKISMDMTMGLMLHLCCDKSDPRHNRSVEICDHSIGFNEGMKKHCELMIRFFGEWKNMIVAAEEEYELEVGYEILKKLQIIIGLVKRNACDIDEHMCELVRLEIYTENEYNVHMKRFYEEFTAWQGRLGM